MTEARKELTPIELEFDDHCERYGRACDAVCRTLWAEEYGISADDTSLHTSDEARRVASAVFDAINLVQKGAPKDPEARFLWHLEQMFPGDPQRQADCGRRMIAYASRTAAAMPKRRRRRG